jgi:hypothetical protein
MISLIVNIDPSIDGEVILDVSIFMNGQLHVMPSESFNTRQLKKAIKSIKETQEQTGATKIYTRVRNSTSTIGQKFIDELISLPGLSIEEWTN